MARTLRIKVDVAVLATKIEAKRTQLLAEYDKAVAEYPARVAIWRHKALRCFDDARVALESGAPADVWRDQRYRNGRYASTLVILAPRLPEMPAEPAKPNLGGMERDLRLLKASSEGVITVSADDNLASYL